MVAGYKPISFLVADSDLDREALEILEQWQEIPVYTAEEAVLRKLTGFAMTRGMLCGMQRKALPAVEDICRDARRIAILENVVNPTNVRGNLSFCSSPPYGCGASDRWMQ